MQERLIEALESSSYIEEDQVSKPRLLVYLMGPYKSHPHMSRPIRNVTLPLHERRLMKHLGVSKQTMMSSILTKHFGYSSNSSANSGQNAVSTHFLRQTRKSHCTRWTLLLKVSNTQKRQSLRCSLPLQWVTTLV